MRANTLLPMLETAIARGFTFLRRSQLPSGRFPIDRTMHFPEYNYWDDRPDDSPFASNHIVYSLGFSRRAEAQDMVERALNFFVADMRGPGLWHYWIKGHKQHAFIPPDLDDTACISFLLERHGIRFPDNTSFFWLNRNKDGLFYTWIIPRLVRSANPAYWQVVLGDLNPARLYFFWKKTAADRNDVDGVVNANVLFYLGHDARTQPVVDYLTRVIQTGREADCDKWYRDPFPFYYALSRNYHAGIAALGEVREEIVSRLSRAARPDGRVGETVFDTALAACILLNFGEVSPLLDRAIGYLVAGQDDRGGWPRASMYYGGPDKRVAWGSQALTAGFCLEALERYHDHR